MTSYSGLPAINPNYIGGGSRQGYSRDFVDFGGGGGGRGAQRRAGNNFNMGAESPYSPQNNGGPGNPGTANNMPYLPRFGGTGQGLPAHLRQPFAQAGAGDYYANGRAQQEREWNALPQEERDRYQQGGGAPDWVNNKGPAPMSPQDWQNSGAKPQFQGGDIYDTIRNLASQYQGAQGSRPQGGRPQGGDPFNRYGFAGQSPQLGRYVPPMMRNHQDLNSWEGGGGYAYNIPNSYGSGQWNQFNSRDQAFGGFGQSPNTPRQPQMQQAPSYQSPFGRPDPARQDNYLSFLQSIAQPQQGQSHQQPGTPDQPVPVN